MATFAQISQVRLRINDPEGYSAFLEVATGSALPSVPAPYTAYRITDTGAYKATDITSGATESDYSLLSIRVSDARIGDWIDDYSVDQAECKALDAILVKIGEEMRIIRLKGGAEDLEWTALKDLYNYYKALSDACKERYRESQGTNTGRYGYTDQPEIAGGEI